MQYSFNQVQKITGISRQEFATIIESGDWPRKWYPFLLDREQIAALVAYRHLMRECPYLYPKLGELRSKARAWLSKPYAAQYRGAPLARLMTALRARLDATKPGKGKAAPVEIEGPRPTPSLPKLRFLEKAA